jgi:hypothetical protein
LDRPGAIRSGEGSIKCIFLLVRGVVGALGELTNLCNSSQSPTVLSSASDIPQIIRLTTIVGLVLSNG